ncbi:RNA pseudouridine synthase ['Osedax' symbiont bacterium Rs2_46_30_T18]|nr:RNA pseudouridine synthase ['Osedax' symbiont bacterium Rs2_46_30_T18]
MPTISYPLIALPEGTNFDLCYQIFAEQLFATQSTVSDFMQLHLPLLGSAELQQWLADKSIRLDGVNATAQSPVSAGQTLCIELKQHFEQQVNCQWQLIWENAEIMALYKPQLLAVSRTTRNLHNTLVGLVRRQSPYHNAQLLHRLDIETSGLILLAKDSQADKKWKPQLQQLITTKIYHAIVKGVPSWQQYDCETELAERLDSEIRCKMYVVDDCQDRAQYRKPKQARTLFKVLKSQGDYSLIQCQLFTGRKHQIRAHLAYLGLPIVGDKIYSHQGHYFLKRLASTAGLSPQDYLELGAQNHLLRAVQLNLQLSDEAQPLQIECPSFDPDIAKELYVASDIA